MTKDVWDSTFYYVITLMVENVGRFFVEEVEWENRVYGSTIIDYTTTDCFLNKAYAFYPKETALNACEDINKTIENEKERYVVWKIEDKITYEEIE